MPSMTQGRPGEVINTGTREQKLLSKQLGNFLRSGLSQGATPLEGDLFSGEENAIFNELFQSVMNPGKGLTESNEFFRKSLAGAFDLEKLDREAGDEFFQEGVVNPMMKTISESIIPQIRRNTKGFSTRTARSIEQVFADATDQLAGEAARLELERQKTNLDIDRFNLQTRTGAATVLPTMEQNRLTRIAGIGAVAEGRQNRRLAESGRMRMENNPFIAPALGFLGTPQTQVVDTTRPSGFGDFIASANAVGGLGANIAASAAGMPSLGGGGGISNNITSPPPVPSDRRLKKNINYFAYPFATWDWNDLAKAEFGLTGSGVGVIAQDGFLPTIEHPSGYLHVIYGAS